MQNKVRGDLACESKRISSGRFSRPRNERNDRRKYLYARRLEVTGNCCENSRLYSHSFPGFSLLRNTERTLGNVSVPLRSLRISGAVM